MSYDIVKLSDVCDVRDGTHDSPKFVSDGYPLVTSKNIKEGKLDFENINYLTEEDYVNINKRSKVNIDDIIMPMIGTIGNPYLVNEEPNYAIKNVALFKPNKNNLLSKFLYSLIISPIIQRQFEAHSRGGTQKFVSLKILRELKIPLPPLETQKKIVDILDKAQSLIDQRKEQIKEMDSLVQSLFYDMFGDPVTNPMGWEVKPVIELCDCIVPARDKPKSFTGSIPWITTNDLNTTGSTYKSKESKGLTIAEIEEVKRKIIPINSVIMSCVGDLGITSINSVEIVMNQQLHSFQCKDEINPYFLKLLIPLRKDYLYKMAAKTTVPYLNKTKCNSIPIIKPPIELQNTFANRVQKIEEQKEYMTSSLKELEDNFNCLMQKAFKGELV